MNSTSSATRRFYEKYWSAPEGAPPETDPLTDQRVELFLRSNSVGAQVLDVGCGSGRSCALLERHAKRVTGTDISLTALQQARSALPRTPFVASALEAGLPFADASFDAVICCEVIEHLLDVVHAFDEMHRVLRPGGLLFLSTPYHGMLKNLLLVALHFERHFNPLGAHVRFFSVRSLRDALRAAEFQTGRVTCLGRFWPVWMNMVVCARKI